MIDSQRGASGNAELAISKGYFKTARGHVIYSPRAAPSVNKSRAHEVS